MRSKEKNYQVIAIYLYSQSLWKISSLQSQYGKYPNTRIDTLDPINQKKSFALQKRKISKNEQIVHIFNSQNKAGHYPRNICGHLFVKNLFHKHTKIVKTIF